MLHRRLVFLAFASIHIGVIADSVDSDTGEFKSCPWCKSSMSIQQAPSQQWPYSTYKPVSWDKYYASEFNEKPTSVTSGVAAGITIGVFFAVFLLTFGCRIYSQRVERSEQNSTDSDNVLRPTVSSDLWICGVPREPPPPYEVAITMPRHCQELPPPAT
ncbi:hypothetical protein QR680_005998 [Steinernema hermaphroditum]|uniref:LITAF domain-containing protein n=1 Tax=Steinernema hermaphroditum TaxID=289476 RepID=A0AA39LWN1_9BILA|nr:hypothetical protein QR680_005998 [Steinernema hermaphroditum]